MGASAKRPGGKSVALVCVSLVAGLLLVGVVGLTASHAYGTMVDRASMSIAGLQDKLCSDYETASGRYIEDLVLSRQKADAAVGVVVPEGSADDPTFQTSLEAAGLDPSRIVMDGDGVYVYLIAPGDTLTSLSAAFGYSVDELANYNEIRDVNLIYANSSLRVPTE